MAQAEVITYVYVGINLFRATSFFKHIKQKYTSRHPYSQKRKEVVNLHKKVKDFHLTQRERNP